MTTVNIKGCKIANTQIGDNNSMIISDSIPEEDWIKLETFFRGKLEIVEQEYYSLIKEAENYVKKRDKNRLKEFIYKHAAEFAKGIFCNIASTGIVELLQKFGIWI